MKEIYLTQELKDWYMYDFNHHVLTETDEFWALDPRLVDPLVEVNQNVLVQSLFSKYCDNSKLSGNESYFKFAYTEEIELDIFRKVLVYFVNKYTKTNKSTLTFFFSPPENNPLYKEREQGNSKIKMACFNDEHYYRINSIRITMQSHDMEIHDDFWSDIRSVFSQLKQ